MDHLAQIVADTDVKVSVSANDTTPDFEWKLVAGTNIFLQRVMREVTKH
ncbi:MAG: hypothetical protein CM15mV69_310 [Caudoviricetes sp.]|nr:MAG: hypothetical protein CM15mV69_310 [Caudoviricetes sp.]